MKQKQNLLIIAAIALGLASCGGGEVKEQSQSTAEAIPTASLNDSVFNAGFKKVLASYYSVRDGLVDWDTTAANLAASKLAIVADSLDLSRFANDSSAGDVPDKSAVVAAAATADAFAGTIVGSAKALAREGNIQSKRKEFQMISDALYDLAKAVKYDREKIYHIKCPMAFNDSEEAFWVSDVSDVKNPYLGTKHPKYKNKMLECGEVMDSIGTIHPATAAGR